MQQDKPPSSPKKQQLVNKQKIDNYAERMTATSRKTQKLSKSKAQLELSKQEIHQMQQDLVDRYESVEGMVQQNVLFKSGILSIQNYQQVQLKQPEKSYKVVVQNSQSQALLKGQSFSQKDDIFLLKRRQKSYQTLKNEHQQEKPQKKQSIHEEKKPLSFQQVAQNHQDLEKLQLKHPENPYEVVVQHSQPQASPNDQYFAQKGDVSLLKKHEKPEKTLQNKYQQAQLQKKQIYQQQSQRSSEYVNKVSEEHTNQRRSDLTISLALNIMLAQEIEKHNKIIEKFMYDSSLIDQNAKILKKTKLARLLQKVFIKKTTMATSETLDELAKIADQLCKDLLKSLTEQEYQQYQLMANQYNEKYKKSNKGELNKLTKSFSSFMKNYGMTPYMAIKLDLLSYFLRNNIEYEINYGKMHTDVVTPIILAKVLNFDKEDIDRLRVAFEDKWNFVSLYYYEHFKDLIVLTTLVAIRQKVENNEQKKTENVKQKAPQLSKYIIIETDLIFKFSRLAFQTQGMLIKTIRTQKRLEIIQSFKSIIDEESQKKRKELILHLKRKFTVSIRQLTTLLDKLEHRYQQFLIEYEEQVRLLEGIKQLPWRFYSPKSEGLKKSLRKLSQCSVTSQQLYEEDNYFATVLSRMIVQRMKELLKLTLFAIKWEKKYAHREFIYVHRLEYSYNRMHNLEEKDDLVATFIIGTARGKIIFIDFVEKDGSLSDKQYKQQLQAIFDQKLKIRMKFGVIISEFDIRKKFDQQEFTLLRRYFWQRHRAIILIAGPSSHFHLHFALDLHVKNWGRKNSKKTINKNQFFAQIRSKICSTARIITSIGAIAPTILEQ